MTKKEMMKHLDSMMMTMLKCAIRSADANNEHCAKEELEMATGIMFSASALGLLSKKEFENINHCLSHTGIRWCK